MKWPKVTIEVGTYFMFGIGIDRFEKNFGICLGPFLISFSWRPPRWPPKNP